MTDATEHIFPADQRLRERMAQAGYSREQPPQQAKKGAPRA